MTQWRCQCSAWRGWPPHSMCSSPHWQVGLTGRLELISRKIVSCEPGTKAIAVSRFREKLSPANWVQGVTAISRKISRSSAPKKWGPTCDRDISNSAIYATAIYRAYTVLALYEGTPPVSSGLPSIIRASNVENLSISWCHREAIDVIARKIPLNLCSFCARTNILSFPYISIQ